MLCCPGAVLPVVWMCWLLLLASLPVPVQALPAARPNWPGCSVCVSSNSPRVLMRQQFVQIDWAFKTERHWRWLGRYPLDGRCLDEQHKHLSRLGTTNRVARVHRNDFHSFKLSAQGWHHCADQHLVERLLHACRCRQTSINAIAFQMLNLQLDILLPIHAWRAIHFDRHHPVNAVSINVQVQAQD